MTKEKKAVGRPRGRKYQSIAVTVDRDLVRDLYACIETRGGTITAALRAPVTEAIKQTIAGQNA